MNKTRVFVSRHINIFNDASSDFPELEITMPNEGKFLSKGEILKEAKDSDALITLLSDQIDADFIHQLENVKVISNFAVGFNNIDVKAASDKGISVGNTPDTLTHSTAETALTLLLMLSRRASELQMKVKAGDWKRWEPEVDNGYDLREKKVGIVGFGRIGQAFAKMAYQIWDAEILVWERPSAHQIKCDFPFRVVNPTEFKNEVDIISLHCPLNEGTQNFLNSDLIQSMRKNFFFINTARGGCHDETELLKGLMSGKILGVGLDVTNPEPMLKDSPLLQSERVVVLPHIGSATDRTRKEMAYQCLENIRAGLKGETLPFPVN